jgi:ABC-2 type transport system ATP-binding protein
VSLPSGRRRDGRPDLVRDLAPPCAVHAVEPSRISLEDRLLGILRDGEAERAGGRRDDGAHGP